MFEDNIRFRVFLKENADEDELDRQFLKLHKKYFANYDCCKCAKCCKELETAFDENDVKSASIYLEESVESIKEKYLKESHSIDNIPYESKVMPCVFLEIDGKCRIQPAKPHLCRDYPFTNKPNRLRSMLTIVSNAEVCPVVNKILERLKIMYDFYNEY
ncbi:MAG: YkgJ family cysteine cluster protein [Deltaproteobacteria bacterium]|jgi:Fe-S-cluster containining protein|nr:YkgJ family cysteine cluster protein [Deltaproteobacteria bacterium]